MITVTSQLSITCGYLYRALYTGIDLFIAIAVITEKKILMLLITIMGYKWRPVVAVVAESIRCLGQETEQYEVCSPEFNIK